MPIGDDSNSFTAVFEGNGHTITGLATVDFRFSYIGLFGYTDGAEIRNLGLVDNLAKYTGRSLAYVGGLVGHQEGGTILASYTTGDAEDGYRVGGLVGEQEGGTIIASYARGKVDSGEERFDKAGGLVGLQDGGTIIASYAIGAVNGGAGSNSVGGLVGEQEGGTITASWARGNVDGGAGNDDVGGLVGESDHNSTIIASYATGNADGGAGSSDGVGSLVGSASFTEITASWGFGDELGRERGSSIGQGSRDRPTGITSATGLTAANTVAADASWNAAASNTMGAWNFGTTSQLPALNYADYDGTGSSGTGFHCASAANPPSGAILIPSCGTLIPGQRPQSSPAPISGSLIRTGVMRDALVMGSTWVNGVVISGDYLNFLMAGGDSADAAVGTGVSLYVGGTGMALATYAPSFCADKYLKGGQHWAHFDVRALDGLVVDLEIHGHDGTDIGNDATSDCGFITFDHFYQSDSSQGTAAGTAAQPDSR